jgi:hypothetical protein
MHALKRTLESVGAVTILVIATIAFGAGTANAADGWVYVVVNNSHCDIGQVKSIQVSVNSPTGWSKNWDNDGDNITYPKVRLGVTNNLTLNAKCFYRGQPIGYAAVPSANIKPTSTGQIFWV